MNMMKKSLVCGIIILFLGASFVPSVGSDSLRKECSLKPWHPGSDGIEISGTMGENGWYISNVQITLEFPSYQIFWKIDDQCDWIQYLGMPIIFPEEGPHTIYCFYIDDEGNFSETFSASFKIDKTPPTVTLETHRIGLFKIGVTVYAYDNMSGVGVIEFYLDDMYIGTITTPPYEFVIYTRLGKHTVDVIVYDCAGNSEESSISVNSVKSQKSYLIQNNIQLLNNLLYKFIHDIEN
jgi:hypothetical protein